MQAALVMTVTSSMSPSASLAKSKKNCASHTLVNTCSAAAASKGPNALVTVLSSPKTSMLPDY